MQRFSKRGRLRNCRKSTQPCWTPIPDLKNWTLLMSRWFPQPCLAFSFSLAFIVQVLLALASDGEDTSDLLPGEVAYINPFTFETICLWKSALPWPWPGVPRAATDNSHNATKLLAHMEGWSMIIRSRQLWSEKCDDQDVCHELLLAMLTHLLTCSGSDSENISWNNNWRGQAWSRAKHEGWYLIFLSKLIMAFSFGCY